MSKNVLFFMLLTVMIPLMSKAEWVPLNNAKSEKTPPKVTLLSSDQSGSVIRVEISGFDLKEFAAGETTYQSLDLLTEAVTTEPGMPELPYIAKILAVPDQASVDVEIVEMGRISTFKDINLAPARKSWYEGDAEPPYEENRAAYSQDAPYPRAMASAEPPAILRDFRIARVSVYPVRYNPARKELQVVSTVTIRVKYGNGKVVNPRTTPQRPIAPSFAKLYRSNIFNYQEVLDQQYGGREDGHDLLLAIMPDEFYDSFQIYAEWKRQSGTDIHVTKFFDIGGNTNNPDVIKAYIADAYHNWEVPPTYVLIVGDQGVFPEKTVTYPDYSFADEDYFVEIDGNDYFPELYIGRWTNQGDTRMQIMINKFMLYEKQPNTVNTEWFKHGTVCSNNSYQSQVETKRFAASVMQQYGGFAVDTLMSDGSWGYDCTVDLQDVLNAINNGRSYLNYRGEGWYTGWSANCYSFQTSDVSSLNNGERFTFVTSIGCGVAMFDAWGVNNCFGEEWLELGSMTAPRGGVAFLGPTSNTHTTYNNKIDRGVYVGMFIEGMDTPAEALLNGKMYMYTAFGGDYYTEYHFYIYCCLGDPSIHIWKDVPLAVTVEHPDTILVGPNQVPISVNFTSFGTPAANAQVTIAGSEIWATGFTDDQGTIVLDVTPTVPDTVIVTVRGGNVYPSQTQMIVVQPAELVEPTGYPAIADLDGNLDGLADPNEHCNISFVLRNWGSQMAYNVKATLSSPDENIQVLTTTPISYGNMSSGMSENGNPTEVYISENCPVGYVIPLLLHIESNEDSWDYSYDMTINGCNLDEYTFMINDEGSSEPNYRMDPGETVKVFISARNSGNDSAPNVMGFLSTDDSHITIVDSVGSYGTIGIGQTNLSTPDYFVVTAHPDCPTNYLADYSLKLKTFSGNYPYKKTSSFQIPVSKPISSDYTGPDAYGYYAYSSDDYFDQAPDYSWAEVSTTGTRVTNNGVGDYTQTVTLPFNFKYYGIDYTQVRISTDGWLAFGSGTQTAPINAGLPHNDNVNNMVACFWDDLYDAEVDSGFIYYYNDNYNHRFVVEWDTIARNDFGSEPSLEVFEAVLYDPDYYPTPTGDGVIIVNYKQVMSPEFCTIGIENQLQDIGIQYVFNNAYDPTASPLINQFAVKFTTEPPFASIITSTGDSGGKPSNGYLLGQNHPNPFRNSTWIDYTLPESCQVSVEIFDVNGGLIKTLVTKRQAAGSYTVKWDGSNAAGNPVSSGVYLYKLKTQNFEDTGKMFIVR
jgi:hypothetical protein